MAKSAEAVQAVTGETGNLAAAAYGIRLEVVKLSDATHGFVLPPQGRVVERSFA